MSRPRAFDIEQVVDRAMHVFWSKGYQRTALPDLEIATGLSRSSLYQAFGSKSGLFAAALDQYLGTEVEALLGPMEARQAQPGEIVAFLGRLRERFCLDSAVARRGCMWVNAIAEFTPSDPEGVHASRYRQRLFNAFYNCLGRGGSVHGAARATAERRSQMLAATVFGLWLLVRANPAEAARMCESVAVEVGSWAADAAGSASRDAEPG